MGWLKQLLKSNQEPVEPLGVLCSGCSKVCPSAEAHVIPWWNTELNDFLTTYRCGECRQKSLGETRARVKTLDAGTREKFCELLERHGYTTDAESIRQASLEAAPRMIETVLDAIESGEVRLSL